MSSSAASAANVAEQFSLGFGVPLLCRRVGPVEMGGGMRCGVNLLEQVNRHPRVQLRGRELGVSEHRLNHRMSAPFSSIKVATVWRNRWQPPILPMSTSIRYARTSLLRLPRVNGSPRCVRNTVP